MIENIKKDRFAKYCGIKLVEVMEGYALTEMEIEDHHLNGVDIVHGGAVFTLADYAFAAASNSRGFVTVGLNVSISYFRSPRGKVIRARASEIVSGKKVSGYSIDVLDEDGSIVARFTGLGFVKG